MVSGLFSLCGLNEKQFDWSVVEITLHILHGSPKSQDGEIGILIAVMDTGVV